VAVTAAVAEKFKDGHRRYREWLINLTKATMHSRYPYIREIELAI
jgi:hypothetical protein